MPSPSNLLKKANTAKYVLSPENGGQLLKNPAYYMQPPTANSTAWSPEQPMAQQYRAYSEPASAPMNTATPAMPPQYGYAPAQAFTPPPMQYGYAPVQPTAAPQAQVPNVHNTYGYYPAPMQMAQAAPIPPMAPPVPQPVASAPVVHNADMYISVQPPNIPAPIVNRNPSIYKDLMKKHDRAAAQQRRPSAKMPEPQ